MTKRQMVLKAQVIANETGEVMVVHAPVSIYGYRLSGAPKISRASDLTFDHLVASRASVVVPAGQFSGMNAEQILRMVAR